jgi:hypothetical protein
MTWASLQKTPSPHRLFFFPGRELLRCWEYGWCEASFQDLDGAEIGAEPRPCGQWKPFKNFEFRLGMVAYVYNPSYLGRKMGGSWFKASVGKSMKPYLKNKRKRKKTGAMAQVVENLLSKHEAELNP